MAPTIFAYLHKQTHIIPEMGKLIKWKIHSQKTTNNGKLQNQFVVSIQIQ